METPRGPSRLGLIITAVLVMAGLGALVWVMAAKTEPTPEALSIPQASVESVGFGVAPFDRVCRQYVNEVGLVNYQALKANPADLEAFLQQVRQVSPHSNLAAFTTKEQALAYWINAYNAWMMYAAVQAYPVENVTDISKDPDVFNAKGRVCGGEDLSLDAIENEIVRKEFLEPRVHFALNCASRSCPWLPQEAFRPEKLEQQLDREARRFVGHPTHVRVDVTARTVWLSQIFEWYGEDFLKWLTQVQGIQEPVVLDYVKLYVPASTVARIEPDFQVKFEKYGWELNDQQASWTHERWMTVTW